MPVEILVPPLSQTMDTLILVEWIKQVGEPVTKGETLFRVETDKATLEVEAPASGVLQEIRARPGEEIAIGASIGRIVEPGEAPSAELPAASSVSPEPVQNAEMRLTPQAVGPLGEPLPPERLSRTFASPRARQFAAQHGLSLAELRGTGSGPQGLIVERDVQAFFARLRTGPTAPPVAATPLARRMAGANQVDLSTISPARPGAKITKADVEARLLQEQAARPSAPPSAPAAPAPASRVEQGVERAPLSPTRKTIARRMLESQTSAAAVTYMSEVDATRLVRLRQKLVEEIPAGEVRLAYADFLARILCLVLPHHPDLNATFDGEVLERWQAVHLALAVDTERGLVAPVLRNAQAMGIAELARERSRLVHAALQGSLRPEEMHGGTFTLSNLGMFGVDAFTPILNPPQVAILGVGRIRQAPAVYKGKLRARHLMGLSLTCDHRIVDGAPAARFLQEVCRLIENPDLIWLE